MITDDTILERLYWKKFERSGESYRIAREKYRDILSYIFPELNILSDRVCSYGVEIKALYKGGYCFKGINLNFYNYFEGRTCFRLIEFKGKAKDFKAKVLKKFEVLKSLRLESDNQTAIEGNRRIAEAIEIQELIKIAKRAFDKYKVDIEKNSCAEGYTLKLEIYFSDKRELLSFCDKEE